MNWTLPAFEDLARVLSTRTGLAFVPDRRPAAESGIRRAMARSGIADPKRYRERLARDPALFDDLMGELTVGETYFFREPAQFDFIRDVVLPDLRKRRGPGLTIRAWSAACASGEEAYSLAMLLADEGLSDQSHLLATDISRGALDRAIRASYSAWSLRGEGAERARRHLRQEGERFVVEESIRRRVTFESLNLALDVYPSHATGTLGLDLIFCRNVLIYFDRATVGAVASRLYESLSEGGWLLSASTDPPLGAHAPFEMVTTAYGIFYRRETRRAAPTAADRNHVLERQGSAPISPPFRQSRDVVGERAPPPPVVPDPPSDAESVLTLARDDLDQGRYGLAAERTRKLVGDAEASALHVRAVANLDPLAAELACAEATARHPLSSELHYLRAVLLLGLGREAEAASAARRALYLDRELAIGHFLLGAILRRRGDRRGAWRAFRNARDLSAARPAQEVAPLSDGEPSGRLVELASLQMAQLTQSEEESS